MTKQKYPISGMHCASCASKIETAHITLAAKEKGLAINIEANDPSKSRPKSF